MKTRVIAGLILSLPLAPAWALSMTEAVEQAVLRNPEVQMRWHQLHSADQETAASRGGYYPRVDAQGYAGREWQDYPGSGNTRFFHPGASIELRQMLFDGFATRSAVRRAAYQSQSRYYELLSTTDQIAQDTARAYMEVLRYRRLSDLARDNWATHKEIHEQIAERVKAGASRRVDLEQAAGRLALADSNWLTEAANLHDVSARYERLVGTLPVKDMTEPPALQSSLPKDAETLPLALRQNPSFLGAIANLRAARAQMDAQKSANYPTVELRASQGVDRNRDGVPGNYSKGVVQLSLNYNLYKGGSDTARTRAAGESLNAAFDYRDKVCRDIRQETRIAQSDVKKLVEQIRYLDQHQLATEKAREAYRKQFDIGQRTLLDLLDTENELFESRRALVRAEGDYQQAQVRVLAQTHQLLPVLKLSPLEKETPEEDVGGSEAEDARIACGYDAVPDMALDHDAALAARPSRPPVVIPPANAPILLLAPAPAVASKAALAPQCAEKDVVDLLTNWTAAWSGKHYKDYLAYFSTRFEPPRGQKLEAWKALRSTRLAKTGPIDLTVGKIKRIALDNNHAEASFYQTYSADGFSDNVDKTLDLVCEGGQWKILHERVTRGRVY